MSTTFENPNVETSSGADPSVSHELCRFATNLLEACGGLVEWEVPDQAGTAILPSEIGNIFGVKEEVTLSPRQEPGGLCLGLSSEFLDQSDVALRSMVPRIGNFTIPDITEIWIPVMGSGVDPA